MSKSKGNVVSPDDMIARYGADATRMYALFAAPPDRDLDWQDSGIEGIRRFIGRVYTFFRQDPILAGTYTPGYAPHDLSPEVRAILRKLHQTIRRITEDLKGRWHFNTSVAALMELLNELNGAAGDIPRGSYRAGAASLPRRRTADIRPVARSRSRPTSRTNSGSLGREGEISLKARWPKYDAALAEEEEVEIPVQVNGKLRGPRARARRRR